MNRPKGLKTYPQKPEIYYATNPNEKYAKMSILEMGF
jgi:hypothetical protein